MQRNRKNKNEGFDNLHIMLLIHVYASAKIRQVKIEKDRLKDMQADVSGVYRAISDVLHCVTGPL